MSEVNDDKQQNLKPIIEWSDDEIKIAKNEVLNKYPDDWSDDDKSILWEWASRQWREYISRHDEMKKKTEFNIEEWIRFQTEILVDIYYVAKLQEYRNLIDRSRIAGIRNAIHVVNQNVCSIPPPYPPYPPVGQNLSGIEMKLDEILRLLGGESKWR